MLVGSDVIYHRPGHVGHGEAFKITSICRHSHFLVWYMIENDNHKIWALSKHLIEEGELWLDRKWYGYEIAVGPKCTCGSASVGGIPHYDWCDLAGLEDYSPVIRRKYEV